MAQPATNAKIEELRFKVKTDPKSRLFYPLAEELRKAGSPTEAEQVLHQGLTVHPTYLSAWVSLGRVLREQKKDPQAVEALSKALQLDPGNVVAARLLADAYLNLGEKVEAIKKYKLVYALMPSDEALKEQIDALDRDIRSEEAPTAPVEEPSEEPAQTPVEEPPQPVEDPAEPPVEEPPPPPHEEPPAPVQEPTEQASVAEATPEAAPEPELFSSPFDETPEPQPEPGPLTEPEPAFSGEDTAVGFKLTPTIESPFADALQAADDEARMEIETGDAEPMSVAHDESPFEEEPSSGYSSAAMTIEAPSGFHIDAAPMGADVASPLYEEEPLPILDAAPIAPEQSEEADVFEPDDAVADPIHAADDVSSTITMADLYARQGLVDDARQIYESILIREPENAAVGAKLAALNRGRTVQRLESWLAKVARKEVGRV